MGKKSAKMVFESEEDPEVPSDGEEFVHEEPKLEDSKVKGRINALEKKMGQFFEALYAHWEKSATFLSEMD